MSLPPLGKRSRPLPTWPSSGKAARPPKFPGNLGAEVTRGVAARYRSRLDVAFYRIDILGMIFIFK